MGESCLDRLEIGLRCGIEGFPRLDRARIEPAANSLGETVGFST